MSDRDVKFPSVRYCFYLLFSPLYGFPNYVLNRNSYFYVLICTICRQRDREGKGVVYTTPLDPDRMISVQSALLSRCCVLE